MRLAAALRNDVRLQVRHGFYAAYAVVICAYLVLLHALPPHAREVLLPLLVLTDPAVYGFVFVGGILLLERSDGTLESLFVSPLRPLEYVASKALSLGLLALASAFALVLPVTGLPAHPLVFAAGVGLTATFFVCIGIAAATRFRSFVSFMLGAGIGISVFFLPVLRPLGLLDTPWLRLLPTDATLRLVGLGLGRGDGPLALPLLVLATSNAAALVWALRWLDRHVIASGAVPTAKATRHRAVPTRPGRLAALLAADGRNLTRDPVLLFVALFFVPLGLAVRFGLPALQAWLAQDLTPWLPLLAAFLITTTPLTFGWAAGFLLLDERDEGVLTAFAVTPFSARRFLAWRLALPTAVGFGAALLVLPLAGLGAAPDALLAAAAVAALEAPIYALFLASFAANKIEGMALGKMASLFSLGPLALLLPWPWQAAGTILPPYWIARTLTDASPWPACAAGLLLHLGLLLLLRRRFVTSAA